MSEAEDQPQDSGRWEDMPCCYDDEKYDGDFFVIDCLSPPAIRRCMHPYSSKVSGRHAVPLCKLCLRPASCSRDGESLCAACEQSYTSIRLASLLRNFQTTKMGASCPLSELHQLALSNSLSNNLVASGMH